MHMVEPQHAEITPIILLAAGAAGACGASVRPVFAWPIRAAMQVAAVIAGLVVLVGSIDLTSTHSSLSSALTSERTARSLLRIWYAPYQFTANAFAQVDTQHSDLIQFEIDYRRRAAQKEPDQFLLWLQLGTAEANNGAPGAEADLRRALQDNPWSVSTLNVLAQLTAANGHKDQAAVFARKSLLVKPDQPSISALAQG